MNKGWIYVGLTCLFELLWVYGFNVASTVWHWAIVIIIIITDFYLLSKACETLPTGTVYAVFAAAGTVGTALMDIYIFGGEFSVAKGIFMGLLVVGVIALKLADNKSDEAQVKGAA
ncbi:QacE family quaternary ammonium compound efflux SMR transporter [Paenibacillus agilis]|uniref:QacE family quaternary ammonium compound efflux SMR transporter n=2 Tax=Paenibacillus agilis TaxID=3020863 RepID=A0A559IVH8_9BACL|nr:QacE family quaternary ammonium compound efflux SMR transporter [Paenibacillus agilis]